MIWESSYWKDDLLRLAKSLRKRTTQKRWPEISLAKFEHTVMLGLYSIRKLVEAKKLSDEVVDRSISVWAYPATGRPVTLLNWDKIHRLYDLRSPRCLTKTVPWLYNQIVHSYVFVLDQGDDGGAEAILFNSDRTRQTELYQISVNDLIELFELVGKDYPATGSRRFNPKLGDYEVKQSRGLDSDNA